MSYDRKKERYHDMDKERTLGLIGACDIEIPIIKSDYSYFTQDRGFKDLITETEQKIAGLYSYSKLKNMFVRNLHLSLMPDYKENKMFLGFSPEYIINLIYKILGIYKTVKLDYFNVIEYENNANKIKEDLKEYIISYKEKLAKIDSRLSTTFNKKERSELNEEKNSISDKLAFAILTYKNLDTILDLYNDRTINDYYVDRIVTNPSTHDTKREKDIHIAWRNLAYLIAVTSLELYEKTKKEEYLLYPYNFYEKCTKEDANGKQMKYANEYYSEQAKYDSKFINFNKECERVFSRSSLRLDYLLNYRDNNRIIVHEKFKPKKLSFTESELEEFVKNKLKNNRRKPTSEEEREKAEKQLKSKLAFYSSDSDFGKHVIARTLISDQKNNGYIGFILDNDNIVLDRFYKEYKDGSSVAVMNEAVYALPLDLYESYGHCMSTIKQNMKNPLVLHKYHTDSDSYTDALITLTKKESTSLISVESFARNNGIKIDDTKLKKLKKDNKKKTE